MIDFYRLPTDFPGWAKMQATGFWSDLVASLEKEFLNDVADGRFIPYIQVHEFEALILVDPSRLSLMYPAKEDQHAINQLIELRRRYPNPEDIDLVDPPSKRIESALTAYDKVASAAQVATAIGIPAIRKACHHFAAWLDALELLGDADPSGK